MRPCCTTPRALRIIRRGRRAMMRVPPRRSPRGRTRGRLDPEPPTLPPRRLQTILLRAQEGSGERSTRSWLFSPRLRRIVLEQLLGGAVDVLVALLGLGVGVDVLLRYAAPHDRLRAGVDQIDDQRAGDDFIRPGHAGPIAAERGGTEAAPAARESGDLE